MHRIVPLKGRGKTKMVRGFAFAVVLAGCLTVPAGLAAQSPAAGDKATPAQSQPASDSQKAPTVSNPFPDDTSTVPVLAPKEPGTPAQGSSYGSDADSGGRFASLPSEDTDPVRSPDDPVPAAGDSGSATESSSLAGVDTLEPASDSDQPEKKRKKEVQVKEPTHQEAASKDIEVGGYYLERKDWKAALSRFESAMVLDPENPEVYWGLAEAERNLGRNAEARKSYQTLLDYDPDGKHGKQARKALKDPALGIAQNPVSGQPTSVATQ